MTARFSNCDTVSCGRGQGEGVYSKFFPPSLFQRGIKSNKLRISSKAHHLDLGELEVPKEHIGNLARAATANRLRKVSILISKTREVPRSPGPSASSRRPIRALFLGPRRSKKVTHVRLEKALPQSRHKKSRAFPVLRAW
jgi:hypothetical protein